MMAFSAGYNKLYAKTAKVCDVCWLWYTAFQIFSSPVEQNINELCNYVSNFHFAYWLFRVSVPGVCREALK